MIEISVGDKVFQKLPDGVYRCLDVKDFRYTPNGAIIILESDQVVVNTEAGIREFEKFEISLSGLQCRLGDDLFLCHITKDRS